MKMYKLSQNKVFFSIFFYFTMMFLVLLLLFGTVSYMYSTNTIDKKNEKLYQSMIRNAKRSIEIRLNALSDISVFLLTDKRLQKLIIDKNLESSSLDIFEIVNDIKGISFTNPNIETISIYIANKQSILTMYGIETASEYIHRIYGNSFSGFDDLVSHAPLWNNLYYLEPATATVNNRQSKAMTFIKTKTDKDSSVEVGIMFLINGSWLDEIVPSSQLGRNTYAYIMDNSSNAIIAGDRTNVAIGQADSGDSFRFKEKIDGVPWEIVIVSPKKSVLFFREYTRFFATVSIVLILAGVAISFLLSFGNYRPVKRIMRLIENHPHEDTGSGTVMDEYALIGRYISSQHNQSHLLEERLQTYKEMHKMSSISRLLTGTSVSDRDLQLLMASCNLAEANYTFMVMTYKLLPASVKSHPDDPIDPMIREFAGALSIHVYRLQGRDDRQVALFGFSDEPSGSERQQQLMRHIRTIPDVLASGNPEMIVYGGISAAMSMEKLPDCYQQAQYALSYAHYNGISRIVEYADAAGEDRDGLYFPIELESRLHHGFKTNDAANVHETLTALIDANVNNGPIELLSAQCLYYAICAVIRQGLASLDPAYEKLDIGYIERHYTLQDLPRFAQRALEDIRLAASGRSGLDVEQRVYRLIEEQFNKPKLTLPYIAQQLHVSPETISGSIRFDLQDTINRRRINHSLELLISSKLPVEQISVLSGFTNVNMFIRVFKRFQGITPGQYRHKR